MEAVLEREPREGDHELCIMDKSGDTKTVWDPDNEFETQQARETFEKHKKKGYLIYRVKRDGSKGEAMHTFDPDAAKLIAIPAVVGG